MLSEKSIKEFAGFFQSTEANIAREYAQHAFLSVLYSEPEADGLAFKGGTALRIVYNSPRFSEDLDFTGTVKPHLLESLISAAVKKVSPELGGAELSESKKTSGGWLALVKFKVAGIPVNVELNISDRQGKAQIRKEPHLIASKLYPSYSLLALKESDLVFEKAQALISRKKPRDVFDLYYIMKSRLSAGTLTPLRKELVKALEGFKEDAFSKEMKVFLPRSYWNLLPGLPKKLINQLK